MHKSLLVSLFIAGLLLSGCFRSSPEDNTTAPLSQDNITQVTPYQTNVKSCDNYLAAIRCLANATSGSDMGSRYITLHNQLVSGWTDVPAPQLDQICKALVDKLLQNPTELMTYQCKIAQ